jgi:predicted amidohydrolase
MELAKKLKSYVIFGYAEKKMDGKKVDLYNSACLIDRKGNIVVNAHKSHLYESDELWAKEGEGFKHVTI